MTTEVSGSTRPPATGPPGSRAPRFGAILALWIGMVVLLQISAWLSGMRGHGLARSVERGAARVESRNIGEVPDDVIRKAIDTQQDSLIFWATLHALGDFVGEPLWLFARTILTATCFAGIAALSGRLIRFDAGLAGCAAAQGFWVLGLAVRVGLMIALRRPDVETSATLLLPSGTYPAALWVALQQLDAFAILGWLVLATGAWRRGQSNLFVALFICAVLWLGESTLRIGLTLILGAGMRMTLIPD